MDQIVSISISRISFVRRQCEGHRRQLNELRCMELKWQRQVDTIGEAVAALSGQVPLGCELHLNDSASPSPSLDEDNVIIKCNKCMILATFLPVLMITS